MQTSSKMNLSIFLRILHEKIQNVENNWRVQYCFTPMLFRYIEQKAKLIIFAALIKAKWQNVGLGVSLFQKYTYSPTKKCEKPNMSNNCFFR